jgi:hypothetical protein
MAEEQEQSHFEDFEEIFPPDQPVRSRPKRPGDPVLVGEILSKWEIDYKGWQEHIRSLAHILNVIRNETGLVSAVVDLIDDTENNTLRFYLTFKPADDLYISEKDKLLWNAERAWLFRAVNSLASADSKREGGDKKTKQSGDSREFRNARFIPHDDFVRTLTPEPEPQPQQRARVIKKPYDRGIER